MILSTTLCTALVSAAIAQPAAPKIAVVNLTDIFDRYQLTRDLEQMFDEKRQTVAAEGERQRDDIELKRKALMDMKPGTADFNEREETLIRAEVEFQAWMEIQERRLKTQHMNWLQMIYGHAQGVISKIATDRGIDLVLTYNEELEQTADSAAFKQQILLRNVIYANNRVNLTETVIEMLDAEYQRRGGAATLHADAVPPPSPKP